MGVEASVGPFERIALSGKITHLQGQVIFKDKQIEDLRRRIARLEMAVLPHIATILLARTASEAPKGVEAVERLIRDVTEYVQNK